MKLSEYNALIAFFRIQSDLKYETIEMILDIIDDKEAPKDVKIMVVMDLLNDMGLKVRWEEDLPPEGRGNMNGEPKRAMETYMVEDVFPIQMFELSLLNGEVYYGFPLN